MTEDEVLRKFNAQKNKHLIYSILIDLIGVSSYLIPGLGEISDVIIAPFSALAIYGIYKTPVGAIAGFAEEALPGTDIVPTATIIWLIKYKLNYDLTLKEFHQN